MKAPEIGFKEGRIHLTTDDGRTASLPLKAFPRLYNATDEQRQNYTLSPFGIHWEELDEDLNFEGFFAEEDKPKIDQNKLKQLPTVEEMFEREYGVKGTIMREEFDAKTQAWYYGEILKQARKQARITQQQLANMVGKKREYIALLERGETDMQLSTFLQISEALGLRFALVM